MVHPREGELVHHNNATWQIDKVIDLKSVLATAVDSGTPKVLLVKDLQALPPPTDGERSQPPKPLDGFTKEDWAIAEERHDAIKPLLELPQRSRRDVEKRAAEIGRNADTLYEWIQRYSAYDDVTALIPQVRGWRKGKRRIPTHADAIIKQVIDDYYLSTKRPTVLKTIVEVENCCQRAEIKCPSASTIRARISQVPESMRLRRRGYSEEARAKFQPTPGHFPNADYPLSYVQIDHTPADIILVDDEHRKPIGRPWITVAIDVYSRIITGFLLSLDAPSETSVALCVAQALLPKEELLLQRKLDAEWPVWGFPDVIHVDNAGEFRSKNFKKSCKAHGIDVEFRPVKRPNYGGHIERLIGTFMTEVHSLPGTTFSSPSQKGDLNPEKHAALTFSEFDDWMFDYLCNVYHRKLHSMIGTTPLAQWEKGVLGSVDQPGAGLPPRPDNPTANPSGLPASLQADRSESRRLDRRRRVLRGHAPPLDQRTGSGRPKTQAQAPLPPRSARRQQDLVPRPGSRSVLRGASGRPTAPAHEHLGTQGSQTGDEEGGQEGHQPGTTARGTEQAQGQGRGRIRADEESA